VPNNVVGLIIGKGGENIKQLQARTGARIQISKDDKQPERAITLIGTPDQIERVRAEINMVIVKVCHSLVLLYVLLPSLTELLTTFLLVEQERTWWHGR